MRAPGVTALILVTICAPEVARSTARSAEALVRGAANSAVTQANIQQTICVPGWTKTVRPPVSYTNALKVRQMAEFGLSGSPHDYEEDHLISLEVGGDPRSPANLWPEPWTGPLNAHEKDRLENVIHRLVCSGKLSLSEGRHELSTNWVASFRRRVGSPIDRPSTKLSVVRPQSQEARGPYFRSCAEARAAGVAPIYRGQPGYAPHLDRDGDGIACESYRGR